MALVASEVKLYRLEENIESRDEGSHYREFTDYTIILENLFDELEEAVSLNDFADKEMASYCSSHFEFVESKDISLKLEQEKEQEDYFEDEFNITLFYAAHIFDEDESEENPLYQQKDESDEEEVLVSTLDVGKDFEITLDELLEYEED